ncbi:hypothetical protein T09_11156 [Trichinella sp. T9]|nr:hypothetical protein T09_11156 [Trichinella sp. T9]
MEIIPGISETTAYSSNFVPIKVFVTFMKVKNNSEIRNHEKSGYLHLRKSAKKRFNPTTQQLWNKWALMMK